MCRVVTQWVEKDSQSRIRHIGVGVTWLSGPGPLINGALEKIIANPITRKLTPSNHCHRGVQISPSLNREAEQTSPAREQRVEEV